MSVKKRIFTDGQEYVLMQIGIEVNPETDIRFESSWYTKDPHKMEEPIVEEEKISVQLALIRTTLMDKQDKMIKLLKKILDKTGTYV